MVAPTSVVLVLWVLPFIKPITTENALFAVLTVMMLRVLVADARRAQRLDLARELHDFVAHDVSGIVAQAQAAQLVARDDPGAALAALGRIEQTELKALACMDNTVHMLHDTDPAEQATACTPLPGLTDLPRLADQFSATSPAQVALRIHPAALETTPREVATTAYRIVVETLTNIRRHAPTANTVEIVVTDDPDPIRPALRVMVTNDSAGTPARSFTRTRRRGGLGLLGLTDRVHALGGNLHAGPHGTAGWQVTAVLPLAGRAGLPS